VRIVVYLACKIRPTDENAQQERLRAEETAEKPINKINGPKKQKERTFRKLTGRANISINKNNGPSKQK
jgi:hypothetical protein